MHQYSDLLAQVSVNGDHRQERTQTGASSLFGKQLVFDMRDGFPLVTTKRVNFRPLLAELLWFLSGSTNINDLDAKIWDEWADEDGELGPVYGKQWRSWQGANGETFDQVANVVEGLRNDPYGRRHIVSAWNVAEIQDMALPPCHCLFQFFVSSDGYLDLQLYQRSADIFLGVPFNIASYALLLHMVAQVTNLKPRRFIHTFGDVHLYDNHRTQAGVQLLRPCQKPPTLELNRRIKNIDDFTPNDVFLRGYNPFDAIKAPVAV